MTKAVKSKPVKPTAEKVKNLNKLANRIQERHFPAHRGVVPLAGGKLLFFGNDGYRTEDGGDPRTKAEVNDVRAWLKEQGFAETGWGLSDCGYTWALLAKLPDEETLEAVYEPATKALWGAWDRANGGPGNIDSFQWGVAESHVIALMSARV
jgi:hypothetical protein